MPRALYLYSHLPLATVEKIIREHQDDFDDILEEKFSSSELESHEALLDSIGAISVQPVIDELSFDDFEGEPGEEEKQGFFFEHSQSTIVVENLPEFSENPFQVSYLLMLIERFPELLIDQGFTTPLKFKGSFLKELRGFRNMGAFYSREVPAPAKIPSRQLSLVDYVVRDVYREHQRILTAGKKDLIEAERGSLPEKMLKVLSVVEAGEWDADTLLVKSGLNPKDFGDHLERVKFFLKRLS